MQKIMQRGRDFDTKARKNAQHLNLFQKIFKLCGWWIILIRCNKNPYSNDCNEKEMESYTYYYLDGKIVNWVWIIQEWVLESTHSLVKKQADNKIKFKTDSLTRDEPYFLYNWFSRFQSSNVMT